MRLGLSVAWLMVSVLHADVLSSRYLPWLTDEAVLAEFTAALETPQPRYWRTAEELRRQRKASGAELPLAGLRLALDPGHLGGKWAEYEARNFRISDDDHWVREGDLVLEVAQRARDQLEALGAEVQLLREDSTPVNPKLPADYVEEVAEQMGPVEGGSLEGMVDHALELKRQTVRRSIVVGELAERARLVNEMLKPDALLSLHINAGVWPKKSGVEQLVLLPHNHLHVLIFGCLSESELAGPGQRERLLRKLQNGSGPEELLLAGALAQSLAEATGLPASKYEGSHALRPSEEKPYVWARNLMLLRLVECPVVLLEPYVANSAAAYARLQAALQARVDGREPEEGDVLLEYADAIVAGVLDAYGPDDAR